MLSSFGSCCRHSPVYIILFAFLIASIQATCYYPSGLEAIIPDAFAPCNSNSSAVSMCCNSQNGDKCTKEGLCLSGSNAYYRDLCTDSTWTAPECVKICLEDWAPRVTLCEDRRWCCGPPENSTSCCDGGKGAVLAATAITASLSRAPMTSTGGSSLTPTNPATTSGSSTSSETAAPPSKAASGKKDNSVAIGAGIGVAGGFVLVCLIAGCWYWRRKQKKQKAVADPDSDHLEETKAETGPNNFRDQKQAPAAISSTQGSPSTRYESEAVEDGSVTTALATGGSGRSSSPMQKNTPVMVHSHGGEIHEMSSRDDFHELPGGDRRLGSYNSVEKF